MKFPHVLKDQTRASRLHPLTQFTSTKLGDQSHITEEASETNTTRSPEKLGPIPLLFIGTIYFPLESLLLSSGIFPTPPRSPLPREYLSFHSLVLPGVSCSVWPLVHLFMVAGLCASPPVVLFQQLQLLKLQRESLNLPYSAYTGHCATRLEPSIDRMDSNPCFTET